MGMLILLAIFGIRKDTHGTHSERSAGHGTRSPDWSVLLSFAGSRPSSNRTLASNVIFMGHGPWTIFQAIGWGAVGISGSLLSDKLVVNEKLRLNRLAFMAAAAGVAFNWFVS